jgi:hypothetical protein
MGREGWGGHLFAKVLEEVLLPAGGGGGVGGDGASHLEPVGLAARKEAIAGEIHRRIQ